MLARPDAARAFTRADAGPRPTFALALVSVTVAVVAMHVDGVKRYSEDAFFAGVVGAVVLSIATGILVGLAKLPRTRALLAILLPSAFGALLGMIVQAIVLAALWTAPPIYDLAGAIDTRHPATWVLAGIVLGGVPALVVAAFLVLAARALRRLAGHDASEQFGVGFVGAAGLFATLGLFLVDRAEAGPLLLVAVLAAVTLLATLLVDGSRIRFLRAVFRREEPSFDIVPAALFATHTELAPIVAAAGAEQVLVRVDPHGSYRAAAAEPIALLAASEEATIAPLARRRLAAASILGAMVALAGLATLIPFGS